LGFISVIWQAIAALGIGIWNHLPGTGHVPMEKIVKAMGGHHPRATPTGHPGAPHAITPPSWWNNVRSLAFWIILLVGGAIMLYRVRWAAVAEARPPRRRVSLFDRLYRIWRRLWRRVRRSAGAAVALVPRGLPRRSPVPSGQRLRHFLRLNALSPDEQVRYFYLSLLRRAEEAGLGRRPSQTPGEYAAQLFPQLGESAADLQRVTNAFIEARYSGHHLEKRHVGPVKASWQRLRAALRGRRETRTEESHS
jgi:hypothetical protein